MSKINFAYLFWIPCPLLPKKTYAFLPALRLASARRVRNDKTAPLLSAAGL